MKDWNNIDFEKDCRELFITNDDSNKLNKELK